MEKAVLLLHGFLSDPGDFTPLLPHLKERYARIEIPVYPGHGADESYHDFTAEGTLALIEDKIWELTASSPSVDVIGFSLGSALSAYLARAIRLISSCFWPRRINILISICPFRGISVKNFYAMGGVLQTRPQGVSYYRITEAMFSDDFKALKIVREKYMKRYLRKVYQNFKTLIKTANEGTTEINVPCFIAWGRLDQLVPKESVRMMRALCRHENTVLKIYENHSHLMLLSRASEEIVRDILAFLDA